MKTRNIEDVQLDFLISALSHGNFISTTDILMWMKQQNEDVVSNIKQIPIEQLKGWNYRDDRICHDSGKFFSIDGIHIMTIIVMYQNGINLLSINLKLGFLAL